MKKIGIITRYYKSRNYGGNLQAYALCKALNLIGYDAEQICLPVQPVTAPKCVSSKKSVKSVVRFGIRCFKKVFIAPVKRYLVTREMRKLQLISRRSRAFDNFNSQLIPHSESVYSLENVQTCIEEYDAFITGSDQVWNFSWYNPACFLDFVPSNKTKLSYAASIARDTLEAEQKEQLRKSLADYKAVSVREKSAVKLLEGLSPVDVQTVLDPTLLLTSEEWDEVCAERVIEGEYLLCYFLGDNKKERKIAEQFARQHNLKIVTVPHTAGFKFIDKKFGDLQLIDTSPEQFLSLVKHAKYIFTDSFHAVVFSNIYKKQYFVFNRNKQGLMNSRIVDITELFQQEDRFCAGAERENIEYVASLGEIDYTKENETFEMLRMKSIAFLKENLED